MIGFLVWSDYVWLYGGGDGKGKGEGVALFVRWLLIKDKKDSMDALTRSCGFN